MSLKLFFVLIFMIYGGSCYTERGEKVKVQLLYETLCPFSKTFYKGTFKKIVKFMSDNLEINTYPYGNAETLVDKVTGNVTFDCQHGAAECYGNMLHACALDQIKEVKNAVMFNACMMDNKLSTGLSDDEAAEQCGALYGLNATAIKECAKGEKGIQLHKYYGEESEKVTYYAVPHIRVNGVQSSSRKVVADICNLINQFDRPRMCSFSRRN